MKTYTCLFQLPPPMGRTRAAFPNPDVSARSFVAHLKKYRAVSTAGARGALDVWRDRKGHYHGERQVYGCTVSAVKCTNLQALTRWVAAQLVKIQ